MDIINAIKLAVLSLKEKEDNESKLAVEAINLVLPNIEFTNSDLKNEIEHGPLSNKLKLFWEDVFKAPEYPKPESLAEASSWEVKVRRAGRLNPDSAFMIHKILTTKNNGISRCDELNWGNNWNYNRIIKSKAGE